MRDRRQKQEQRRFGQAFEAAIARKGWDIRRSAEALGITYEHTRKLTKSLVFPSRLLLSEICKLFELDHGQAEEMVIADKMDSKYGGVPRMIAGKDPRFGEFENLLPKLTDAQYEMLLSIAGGMATAN